MNALPKYVVSTTLTDPEWNNTVVIDHDPIDAIRDLVRQPGAGIVQYGFGRLAHALMAAGMLDELRSGCTRSSSAPARPTICSTRRVRRAASTSSTRPPWTAASSILSYRSRTP